MAKTPPPRPKRKFESFEMMSTPSPLRRSERSNNHSSTSSASKFSDNRSSGSPLIERKRGMQEKAAKELALGSREVSRSEKKKGGTAHGERKIKDGRAYLALFKKNGKKVKAPVNVNASKDVTSKVPCRSSEQESRCTDDQLLRSRMKLLGGKCRQLQSCSGLSKRKREEQLDELSNKPEVESVEAVKKHKTLLNSNDDSANSNPGSYRRIHPGCKEGSSVTPVDNVPRSSARLTSCANTITDKRSEQECQHTDERQINLLEGQYSEWKSYSYLSGKGKREQHLHELSKIPEAESNEIIKKFQMRVDNNNNASPYLKPRRERIATPRCKEGASVTPADPTPHPSVRSTSCANTVTDDKCDSASQNTERNVLQKSKSNVVFDPEERRKLIDAQKSLNILLKPEISKLFGVLQLSDVVKDTVEKLLEYVLNNHYVNIEPATKLQAFQISLCWAAASFLKQKVDHKESFSLAKKYLNFNCTKEEVDYVYSMLWCLKETFLHRTEIFKAAESLESAELSRKETLNDHSHTRALRSITSSFEKDNSEYEHLSMNLEYLAQKDVSKSIKDIKKKLKKKMVKLIDKQKEERTTRLKIYEKEKGNLEREKKTESAVIRSCYPHNTSIRRDKIRRLEKKIEEYKHNMDILLKLLETSQQKDWFKLKEKEKQWIEDVQSWARVELLNRSPSKEPKPQLEYLQTSKKDRVNKNSEDFSSLREHGLDQVVHSMTGGVIGSSETPENAPDAVVFVGSIRTVTSPAIPLRANDALDAMTSGEPLFTDLLGKDKAGSSGDDQENSVPVNPCAEVLITDRGTSDNGKGLLDVVELEVYETVNLNGGQRNFVSVVTPSEEQTPENATEYETVSSSHGLHNIVSVSTPSSEEETHIVAVTVPESGVFETVSSKGNLVSADPTSKKQCPENAIEYETVSSTHGLYNVVSVSAHSSEEQIQVATVTIPDKVVDSGVLETVRSDSDQGDLVSVDLASAEQILKKATDYETVSSIHCLHNVVSASVSSSEEQSHVVTVTMPESGVLETVGSNDVLMNLGSEDPPLSEEQIPEKATEHELFSSSQGLHKQSVSSPSSEERIHVVPVALLAKEVEPGVLEAVRSNDDLVNQVSVDPSPSKEVESGVLQTASSTNSPENLVSVDPPSSGEQNPESVTENVNSELHVMASNCATAVNQLNGVHTAVNGSSYVENPLVNSQPMQPMEALVHDGSVTLGQAPQDKGTLLAPLTGSQCADAEDSGMQNTSRPITNLADPSVATSAYNHSDHDVLDNRPVVQVPLLPSSNTPDRSPLELSSVGEIEVQSINEDHTNIQVSQSPLQYFENLPDLSDQTVLQPITLFSSQQTVDIPTCSFGPLFPDARATSASFAFNTQPIHSAPLGASQMPLPLHPYGPDLLRLELEKLDKEKDQTLKSYEDMKQRLKSDCEKEIEEAIAEIRRKYEIRFQEIEAEFHLKRKELDAIGNIVLMNKILAGTFNKYMDLVRASIASGTQQDGNSIFVDQQSVQQNTQRYSPVASSSLASSPAALQTSITSLPSLQPTPPAPATNPHCTAPPMQTAPLFPASFPGIPARPPNINPFLSTRTLQGGDPSSYLIQLAELQQNTQRHSPVASSSLQATPPAPPTIPYCPAPIMQTVPLLPASFSSIHARPPRISSFPSRGIPRGGGEIRAPAPHLQPFRPSSSMPSQQSQNNLLAMSLPRLPFPMRQSGPNNHAHHPESSGGLPPLLRCNVSALELVINGRSVANPRGSAHVNQVYARGPSDVVCLSDDE